MKKLISLVLLMLLTGCDSKVQINELGKSEHMNSRNTFNRVCLQGVIYYENTKRLAPAFKPDGTLYTCNTKENN